MWFLFNCGPGRATGAIQAKHCIFCEGFPRPGCQWRKGMFDPQFLALFIFDQGFGFVRIGVVAAHAAQPLAFPGTFFKKVKFPYDVKISIPVVNADHDGTDLGKTTGNMLADTTKADEKGALLPP